MSPVNCERCGADLNGISTTSMFNTETICMACQERERNHPLYKKAAKEEAWQCTMGNYNYEGIGLPDDLKVAQ